MCTSGNTGIKWQDLRLLSLALRLALGNWDEKSPGISMSPLMPIPYTIELSLMYNLNKLIFIFKRWKDKRMTLLVRFAQMKISYSSEESAVQFSDSRYLM